MIKMHAFVSHNLCSWMQKLWNLEDFHDCELNRYVMYGKHDMSILSVKINLGVGF
jgi:hypothetical protein